MPGTIHQCNKRSWNDISQLILWIYLHQAHRYELRPAIPVQPSEPKCKTIWFTVLGTVEFYTGFCNDISRLVLWVCLHKGHRYELRSAIPAKSSEKKWRNQFDLIYYYSETVRFTQGSEMLSPNSFCGFVFTRAIDMNLDPPFLYNPLNKNKETMYYSETVEFYTNVWNDISQLILWLYLHKGHRYGLRPPNPAKSLNKNGKNNLIHQPKGVGCQKVLFKTD